MVFKLFFLFISFTFTLYAHQTGLSYVEIQESSTHQIEVLYKKPLSDTRGKDIVIHYPSQCQKSLQGSRVIENGFIQERYSLWCGKRGLTKSRIWIEGLVSKDRGVLIKYESADANQTALLRATTPFIFLDVISQPLQLFLEYILLGIEHILSGYDHLLFVLSLILLAKNGRLLLVSVTGFTFAHSITLACGILGIVNIAVAYIEAIIALSILFLARELVIERQTFTKKYLAIIAFVFGLLHGFGFSNVLRSIGVPTDEIPLSLFAFNIGIELGQLLFIFVVTFFIIIFKRFFSYYEKRFQLFLAYFIGSLSSFWLIERVLEF